MRRPEGASRGGTSVLRAFYATVVVVSLAGATQAAQTWLGWPLVAAGAAVAALELGGIVLAHHGAERRRLGESATTARVASGLVAVAAVAVQIYGHADEPGQAGFFATMSALGYVTYLINTEAKRRDALRLTGHLAEIPPTYGVVQWLREPAVTRRARVLAQERAAVRLDAQQRRRAGGLVEAPVRLDALASLRAARDEAQGRTRRAAIARVLRDKIRSEVDTQTADIAVAVYDLDAIARKLTERADYETLTDLVGRDLTPARLTGAQAQDPSRTDGGPDAADALGDVVAVEVTGRLFAAHGTPVEDVPAEVESGEPRKVEPASSTSGRVRTVAAQGRPVLPIVARTPVETVANGNAHEVCPDAHDVPVVTAVRSPASDDSTETRAAAVREWMAVVRTGESLSGAELGRRHGMSARWGQARVREARVLLDPAELPGQLAIPVNGQRVDLVEVS